MKECIELHDSDLVAVTCTAGDAVVSLSPACIHRHVGKPGVNPSSGRLQPATLTISSASITSTPTALPASIWDGFLRIASALYDDAIPASGIFAGAVELSLTLTTGERLILRGQRISIQLHGEPSLVDDFTPWKGELPTELQRTKYEPSECKTRP